MYLFTVYSSQTMHKISGFTYLFTCFFKNNSRLFYMVRNFKEKAHEKYSCKSFCVDL